MSGPTWNDPLYQELQKGIKRKKQLRILKMFGVGVLVTGAISVGYILRPVLESPPQIPPVASSTAKSGSASIPTPAKAIQVEEKKRPIMGAKPIDVFADLPPLSLPTGSEIIPAVGPSGRGTLTIKNGTGEDAAVKLVDTTTRLPMRFVYVRGKDEFTVKGIGSGMYFLRYTQGSGWNSENYAFQKSQTYSQFEQTLDFTERKTDTGVAYHDYTVTLQKVLHGNARTRRITKEQF